MYSKMMLMFRYLDFQHEVIWIWYAPQLPSVQSQVHCNHCSTHRGVIDVPGGGVSELCLSEALEPSEYSYFNLAVASAWAGPHHWKLRPRNNVTQKGMQQCTLS